MTIAGQLGLNTLCGELTEGQPDPPHVLHIAFHGLPLLFVSHICTKLLNWKNLVIRESLLSPHHFCSIFLLFILGKKK